MIFHTPIYYYGSDFLIGFVSGSVDYVGNGYVVIDNNGIGYNIMVSPRTISSLMTGEENVKLYTYTSVKEDSISLYGFISREELELFNLLISVKGVGPKVAVNILGSGSASTLTYAIMTGDEKLLSSIPGIGKKTAQMIVLELHGKLGKISTTSTPVNIDDLNSDENKSSKNEAVDALTALGFQRAQVTKAVDAVYESSLTVEELIKRALKVVK